MSLATGLSILLIFLKNQLLISLIFATVFIFIYFCSDFCVIFFLLLTLGFVPLSLVALGVRLVCLFEIFLVS